MKQTFVIQGRLASLNEYINKSRHNKYVGANFKKKQDNIVKVYIRKSMIKPVKNFPIEICIDWYEKDLRRDIDNVKSGVKYILDALVQSGIIPNDSRKYVSQINGNVLLDRINPRIQIELKGVNNYE